ncbi:U4/U6 snRNP-specific spliceosomal protein [Ganoderma leucocontextum]|nr:U4/U6 snRNP-specific spliceosomal protein [Ganoderma leucocontextum]
MSELTFDTLIDDGNYLGSERARLEKQVKARLREIGEPITLFGERPPDRRDRLIYVLSQINAARGDEAMAVDEESSEESEEEASPLTQKRVVQQRIDSKIPLGRIIDIRKKVFADVKSFANLGSQIGDERLISLVRFSPNSKGVKLWDMPNCTPVRTFRGHTDRVGGVAWHPKATLAQSEDAVNMVSGVADQSLHLWSLNSETPLATMKGHVDRVSRIAFHPSGNYVASASFDTTWRLWDVNTAKEVLLQEGHSKEVYSVEFQNDGALCASGGLDAIGRVWDLRSGRTAMVLDGHVQPIYAITFSPNGYQIATGSGDDSIRIWNMRSLKALYTIAAHTSNVSDIRFFDGDELPTAFSPDVVMNGTDDDASPDVKPHDPEKTLEEWKYRSGLYFVSGGYDYFVKLWSTDDWQLLRTLPTDGGRVMSVDLSHDGKMLASGTSNHNFQIFTPGGS